MSNTAKIRLTKWIIFTVVFGVAPLLATWIVSSNHFSLATIVGHGELFLIAAVLTGDAFGTQKQLRTYTRRFASERSH